MKARVLLTIMLFSTSIWGQAQAASSPLPAPPAAVVYRYWPMQLVQWVGADLPYSMIVLEADSRGAKPLYDVMLLDRAGQKAVHYTNQAAQLAIDKAIGSEAYMVPMQFDMPSSAANGAQYQLRFVTEKSTPVTWQFVQGTEISDQGSGLTMADARFPVMMYREQGALAGEGTALKVGNVTSTAEVWKEISQPPYFIAYHGALSQDVHQLSFVPRSAEWRIDPAAVTLSAGADWKMTEAQGQVLGMHVDSFANGVATLHMTDPLRATTATIEAMQTPQGWALERLHYAPTAVKGDHSLTLSFSPAAGDSGVFKFEVIAGKKNRIAGGTVTIGAGAGAGAPTGGAARSESWVFTQPEEARKPAVEASATQIR
ncbi:MAG TPA: hypothetical protein VGD62_03860 [Acidobacteriaceae bacterium]